MAKEGVGSGDRGVWIAAIVAIGAAGLLAICLLLVVVGLVGMFGFQVFGFQAGSGPGAPVPAGVTPVASP